MLTQTCRCDFLTQTPSLAYTSCVPTLPCPRPPTHYYRSSSLLAATTVMPTPSWSRQAAASQHSACLTHQVSVVVCVLVCAFFLWGGGWPRHSGVHEHTHTQTDAGGVCCVCAGRGLGHSACVRGHLDKRGADRTTGSWGGQQAGTGWQTCRRMQQAGTTRRAAASSSNCVQVLLDRSRRQAATAVVCAGAGADVYFYKSSFEASLELN